MAFNVCDKDGKHLGIVINNMEGVNNTALVALTDLKAQDIEVNLQEIKEKIAGRYKSKTLLGKVNEEKLKEELKNVWQEDYADLGTYDETYMLKLLLFRDFRDFDTYISLEKEDIKGYVFVNTENVKFYNQDTVMIEEELDYIDYKLDVLKEQGKPLFCRVIDYPVLSMDIMGAEGLFFGGGLADLGGRNHVHETKVKVICGNVIKDYEFPVHMFIKQGMPIMIYLKGEQIKAVFCDGIIYSF